MTDPGRPQGLALQLAWRYTFARGGAIATIAWLAVAGLALSIAVLVIVISVVNGFERELRERVLGLLPHVTLHGRSPVAADPRLLADLQARPGVVAVTPFIRGAGMLVAPVNDPAAGSAPTGQLLPVQVEGYDPAAASGQDRLRTYTLPAVAPNQPLLRQGRFEVLLGATIARDLDVAAGDSVTLVLPQVSVTPAGVIPRQKRLRVAGIVNSRSELDSRTAYLQISDASRLFRLGGRVHGLQLRLADLFTADEEARALTRALGAEGYYARAWTRSYGNLYRAILIQKQTMFILLSFLVAVAAFNLVSGLLMVGKQRSGDVAILATLGVSRATFLRAFGLLGLLLGGIGILLGLLAGVLLALSLPYVFTWATGFFSLDLMAEYFISYLPVAVRPLDLAGIAGVSLVLALLSALYPAWRLSRLRPVEVLAHE
ncbi:MAG: ABC transporter permease [Pseudomonadota bacterium]